MRVSNCPRLLPGSGLTKIRTRDLVGRERTLYRYASEATFTPSELKQVLDLATPEGCKAELT